APRQPHSLARHDALPIYYTMSKSITKKLDAHRALIVNSRNEAIAPLLAAHGIDAAYLDEGDALIRDVTQLVEAHKKEYQDERQRSEEHTSELQSRENLVC